MTSWLLWRQSFTAVLIEVINIQSSSCCVKQNTKQNKTAMNKKKTKPKQNKKPHTKQNYLVTDIYFPGQFQLIWLSMKIIQYFIVFFYQCQQAKCSSPPVPLVRASVQSSHWGHLLDAPSLVSSEWLAKKALRGFLKYIHNIRPYCTKAAW